MLRSIASRADEHEGGRSTRIGYRLLLAGQAAPIDKTTNDPNTQVFERSAERLAKEVREGAGRLRRPLNRSADEHGDALLRPPGNELDLRGADRHLPRGDAHGEVALRHLILE
jgi:hypothetical protein